MIDFRHLSATKSQSNQRARDPTTGRRSTHVRVMVSHVSPLHGTYGKPLARAHVTGPETAYVPGKDDVKSFFPLPSRARGECAGKVLAFQFAGVTVGKTDTTAKTQVPC